MTRNYGALRESDKAIKFIERVLASEKPFAFDIEAGYVGDDKVGVALQQFHPDYICCGISFTIAPEWGRYIPFAHDAGGNVDDLPAVARALWRMLRTGRGIAHNAAYELKGMSRWFRETLWDDPEVGAEVRASGGMYPILADTMLLVWLAAEYDPIKVGKDLKSIADAAFGLKMCQFAELFPPEDSDLGPALKRGKIRFARFNTRNAFNPTVISYACEDSVASLLIFDKYYEVMKDQAIFQIEMALIPELVRMEAGPIDETGKATGNMLFNWPVIRKKSAEAIRFGELMGEEILSSLSERLGRVININLNSVKQLSGVLFDERPDGLGLPVKIRSEKTNAPSTSDDALKVIAKSDPIIKRILEYRQVVKLNGSYLTKFIEELGYSGTGYVFPNHNQMGALTGRMSVDQVSYQQWPKPYHFELGSGLTFDFNFRDLFISPPGFRIVGFDYANVEMRIAGALSGERKIIDAFNRGQDLHKATAAATFKVPFDAVTKKQRQAAKAQPLDELVLTPQGWRRMGDLQVGDLVVGSSGTGVRITGVFPQGSKGIYRVTISDGGQVEMCGEHYLTVRNRNTKNAPWVTRSLECLMHAGLRQKTRNGKYAQPKYELPQRPVVLFDKPGELPIDPYFLGLLLGDGGFRGDWCAYYSTSDPQLAASVEVLAVQAGVKAHKDPRTDIQSYHFSSLAKGQSNPLTEALRDLGLWGKIDSEKFIPDLYLRASPADRLSLLQGLMDTDGTPSYSGGSLRVSSPELTRGIQEIARSLGGAASNYSRKTPDRDGSYGVGRKDTHTTQVLLPEGVCPFRLSRKVNKLRDRSYRKPVRILSAEFIGEKEAQCISVDSPDGLYVSSGYSVIHNTLNFAILYGSGAGNIAEMLTTPDEPVTKEDAQALLDDYLAGYPDLARWIASQKAHGREEKVVHTHFRRKFTLWDHYSTKDWIRSKGDRMSVNAPIQGTAADIIKLAMVRAASAIRKAGLQDKIRMTLTVHDALEFLVHESVTTQAVIDLLDPCVNFPIAGFPLEIRADWHEGFQWGAVAEIELDQSKQIKGYVMEYELPWTREAFKWSGDTLHEALDPYYTWEAEHFGVSAHYYASCNPDFVIPTTVEASIPASPETRTEREGFLSDYAVRHPVKTVTVSVREMPTESQWLEFITLLASNRGSDIVKFESPEGTITLDGCYTLKEDQQPQVSLILGGASLSISSGDIDADQVMAEVMV